MSKKIAFVTNICPHYRVRTFEILSEKVDVDFLFYSAGEEWYWKRHGTYRGNFNYEYLSGFNIGGLRINPILPWRLWTKQYDVYIKCINGRFALPVTYVIARLKRKPFILWTGVWNRIHTPIHKLFFPITKYIYQHADAIVTYGTHVKDYLVSEDVCSEKIFPTKHAIDNEAYRLTMENSTNELKKKLNINPEQQIVLYVGRLVAEKGLNFLLEAFASLQDEDAVLVIVGDGDQLDQLQKQAIELGISDRVIFNGYIPTSETISYYAMASVFILPSITTNTFKEPWGLVVNEAFNQGVPVITTDAVGAAAGGLVQDGINGYIVPERDSVALSKQIGRLLKDRNTRSVFSKNARETIANWDNEAMVAGFQEAIDYVLQAK